MDYMLRLRASNKDAVEDYAKEFKVDFVPGKKPWEVKVEVALPCATENEIRKAEAEMLVKNGCMGSM